MPKRVNETPLTSKTKDGDILSINEETFCNKYVEHMGHGTKAAQIAYGKEGKEAEYRLAATLASQMLKKPKILKRIREILDDQGLNDEIVDTETSFLVKQKADNNAKAKGIEIYNKMAGRYKKDNDQKKSTVIVNVEKAKEIKKALKDV